MREIKFRIWNKEEEKFNDIDMISCKGEVCDYGLYSAPFPYSNQDNFIIQQFTGLLDKNNKEIYEGNIVRVSTIYCKVKLTHLGEIVFEHGAFIFGCDTVTDSYMTFIELHGDWEIEILGNIYENPELLKGE